jgi:hypothetical protein
LVSVVVSRNTPPGVTVGTLAWTTISSWATGTLTVHRGSVLPDAQLLPVVVEVTVLARMPPPVSGLSTVTE